MAVFSDSIGNHYMGDCIYANHNINYPTYNFLQASEHSTVVSDITAILSNSGMKYRNVIPQATFNDSTAFGTSKVIMNLAPNSDTIDDRYVWSIGKFLNTTFHSTTGYSGAPDYCLFNDSGHASTTTAFSSANNLYGFSDRNPPALEPILLNSGHGNWGFYDYIATPNSIYSDVHWSGVSDGESVGFFITQSQFNVDYRINGFVYMGIVDDVNTNDNYYSENIATKSIFLMGYNSTKTNPSYNTTVTVRGSHYIGGSGKILLYTGEAFYPIVCSDAQTPSTQWATDLYVLDNDIDKGYPTLGRVRNMLYAQGTYTLGKPVKIAGSVFPDAGHNHWLPVGNYGTYTILLRCYSSVV